MILFIIVCNFLYVGLYSSQKSAMIRILLAAVMKYFWLSISVKYILKGFDIKIPEPVVQAFMLPQLFTATLGVAIVFLLERYFSNVKSR